MSKHLKIAIYSGEIPSTTFIERLIKGLSKKDCTIYLFGILSKRVVYNPAIKQVGYKQNKWFKFLYFLKYSVLLFLRKPAEKRLLDSFLKSEGRRDLYSRLKYYPVLYYKPDIFHLQWAKGIAEWCWVENFGMRLVLSLRGAHINYSPIADEQLADTYRFYFPKISGFHAVSKAMAIRAGQYGTDLKKTQIIYSGLPKIKNSANFIGRNDYFNIISVGRPHWIKGYHYALDALTILKANNINFKYNIVGAMNDMELMYQVKDLSLENHVILSAKQPYAKVQDLINTADLLLLPSVEEGIANVVLEAMSLNTIVLTTDCGGMEEVIIEGINGFIVPIRNSKQMASKIQHIIKLTTEEKLQITKRALLTIREQHTEKKMVNGMMTLYDKTMSA